jgi:hypothetical protein
MSIVVLCNFNKLVWQRGCKKKKVKSDKFTEEKQSWVNFCCALDGTNVFEN